MSDHEKAVKDAAGRVWGVAPAAVFTDDVTPRFSWVKRHRVHLAMDLAQRKLLFVTEPGGRVLDFQGANRLTELSTLFRTEASSPPDGLPAARLAVALRSFLRGPGGFLASQEFLEEQKPRIRQWVPARLGDEGVRLFEENAVDPGLRSGSGEWNLEFRWFNDAGGVEAWKASGRAGSVDRADATAVVPDRTFTFLFG